MFTNTQLPASAQTSKNIALSSSKREGPERAKGEENATDDVFVSFLLPHLFARTFLVTFELWTFDKQYTVAVSGTQNKDHRPILTFSAQRSTGQMTYTSTCCEKGQA